jgi:hypothetical protein
VESFLCGFWEEKEHMNTSCCVLLGLPTEPHNIMKTSIARKHLPKSYRKLSDEQLTQMLNQLELFAEIILDVVENGSKKQLGVIDSSKRKEQNGK